MATIKLTILKDKVSKDGTIKIRVAVCHKRVTKYIVTRFSIDNESQFKNGQVVKRADSSIVNIKLRNLLNEYQEKMDLIKNISQLSCKQLRDILANGVEEECVTFKSVCNEYIKELKEEKRNGYATLLERNCRYFTEFSNGDIPLRNITPQMIILYSENLRKRGLSEASVNMMLSRTRTIINRAKKKGIAKFDIEPFSQIKIKDAPVRECDITIRNFTKILEHDPKERKYIIAKDIFLLSFYLGGINLIDLMNTKFTGNIMRYKRTKTINTKEDDKEITFKIPQEAVDIIKKWTKNGKLNFGYKFSYPNFSRYVCRNLSQMCANIGIGQKVILYSARKSFAQYASELGIPDNVIDYCLGHSDKSKGVIRYYTKVKEKQATIAIQRVIEYVNNPEKFKEYIEMRADIMMMQRAH